MMWRTSPPGGAGDGIGFAAQAERVAVVAPLRLDDLELARDRGLQADEEQPARLAVVRSAVGQGRPVGHAAAQDPVARGEPALPAQRVSGVGAPHVGTARAAQAELVVAVAEVVGAQLVVAEIGVGAVGAQGERAAVAPAADELGRDELLVELQPPGLLGELGAEAADVLVQLAPHHVARVAVEGRGRRRRGPAVLVLVAQDELAGLDRAPRVRLSGDQGTRLYGMPWPRTSSRATPSMAGCENPSVKPKCSRCWPSRAAGCAWVSSSPLSGARSARSQRPASASSASALWAWTTRRTSRSRSSSSQVLGSSPRRSARAAMPSRSSAGKPSRIHAGSPRAPRAR